MGTVVALDGVSRAFGHTEAAVDVSFDVRRGEVFGLLGHNGAGKTTVIRLINGLLRPDAGRITAFGLDPTGDGHDVRHRTGVLTTYPGLDEYLSPRENLAVYAAIHGLPPCETATRSARLLHRLGLTSLADAPSRDLSAGLKQRVALARALIHDPDLLLLDEPTANLDPVAAREVRELVRELADDDRTVILSSHNLAEAEALCDRVAILRSGRLVAVGSLEELARGRLQQGITLHVGVGQAERALNALTPHLNGHETRIRDGEVEVSGATAEDTPQLIRLLVGANVDVHGARTRAPTLEDVYLSVHEQRGQP